VNAFGYHCLSFRMGGDVSNGVSVRPGMQGDEWGCANVHIHSWRETYTGLLDTVFLNQLAANFGARAESWKRILSGTTGSKVRVACEGSEIVGFVNVGPARDPEHEGRGEVRALYLLKAFQGFGVGRLLLAEGLALLAEDGFASAYVRVLAGNPTRRFYEKSGAHFQGESKEITIGNDTVLEEALVWRDIRQVLPEFPVA
jgi:GNAT superfamily N-acetyltransferase